MTQNAFKNKNVIKKATMKRMVKTLALGGLLLSVASSSVFAQHFVTIDEYGTNVTFAGVVAPDPSGGVAGNVLIYNLNFGVMAGDLILTEPGSGSTVADVIRFWNPGNLLNSSQIIFYSAIPTNMLAVPSPADVGIPAMFQAVTLGPYNKLGDKDNNYYVFHPVGTDPGAAKDGNYSLYTIASDVPEPSSVALFAGAGLLALVVGGRFRKH